MGPFSGRVVHCEAPLVVKSSSTRVQDLRDQAFESCLGLCYNTFGLGFNFHGGLQIKISC